MNNESSTQKGKPRYDIILPDTRPVVLPPVRRMSAEESTAMLGLTSGTLQPSQAHQAIQIPQATHSGHLRDNFDVRAMASVAERQIIWDMAIFGVITGVLTVLIWYQLGGDELIYGLTAILVWGAVSYIAMNRNRAQAHDHSPVGVARLEQHSQVAMHDRSMQTEEHRIDSDREVRLAEVQARRELAVGYLKYLEGPKND